MFSRILQTTVILSAFTGTVFASPTPARLQVREDTLNWSCYWSGMRVDGPVFNATMEDYCMKYASGNSLTISKPDAIYSLGMDAGIVGNLVDPGNSAGVGMSVKVTTYSDTGFSWTKEACRDFSNKIWDHCRTDHDTTFGGEVTIHGTTVVLDPRADNELNLVWNRADTLSGPTTGNVAL